jgi:CysZ protein
VRDFITGFKYPLLGFSFIIKPGIRWFVIIPALINIGLFTMVIVYGAHQIVSLGEWLSGRWNWAEWVIWLLWPLFAVLALSAVFYGFTLVANLVAAPWNGFLAQAVVNSLGEHAPGPSQNWSRLPQEIMAAFKNELHKFLFYLLVTLPLLILFLIPMLNVVAPFIWVLFCAWLLALEYLDFPMSNHGMAFPQIRSALKSRKSLVLGFGLGVMLMTLIPLLNFLAMPVAVCSATKLWLHELRQTVVHNS